MDKFEEAPPLGPAPAGNVGGDDAVTEGYSRRFFRQVSPGVWNTADVEFYFWQAGTWEGKPEGSLQLTREIELAVIEGPHYDNGNVTLCDVRDVAVANVDGPATLSAVREACAAFDPAPLAVWDGTSWPPPAEAWTCGAIEAS